MLSKYAASHNLPLNDAMHCYAVEAGISRYGHPEEIADLIAFLVFPAARWMTGAAVRMDGGRSKGRLNWLDCAGIRFQRSTLNGD